MEAGPSRPASTGQPRREERERARGVALVCMVGLSPSSLISSVGVFRVHSICRRTQVRHTFLLLLAVRPSLFSLFRPNCRSSGRRCQGGHAAKKNEHADRRT
ncbi:hypothetical protein CC85DRAFT_104815 [Cutaneotrichosporon oleaginosum]|uniref:Uncharacterized protein n=1 Tax=Cutaneotrichosporon oleaginosum TaxID=879819 RepID=A0A0J0XL77_9TREE|nr:uncharacterized protein CC85DRAFT_104815 [Cutaneotrichosporon oleaginosum]KLT41832.1 hypothetical protein CC85DRAFT_104815 [Cutaneotrichosporon oleaginosum]TXT14753.1 hypothetical protein COLE_00946 [Cutaneotrichosporon oleaginosum]